MKTVVSLLWPINLDVHVEIAALCATVMSNTAKPSTELCILRKKGRMKKKLILVEQNWQTSPLESNLEPTLPT